MESSKVPALARAVDILNLIARIGPCSATTIIHELNIPKSTAYLILGELKSQRFLRVDSDDHYCLWTKIIELAGHAVNKIDLRELARKPLINLMEETGFLCHLGIIDNEQAYYILKVESKSTISVRSHEGKSMSLYRSGIGKCLLAWQPDNVRKRIINNISFKIKTNNTISNSHDLIQELEHIRRQGWSYDNSEDYENVRCVAAPVFNSKNKLIAAISVVGTSLQITESNIGEIIDRTLLCAQEISHLTGWEPSSLYSVS
ncbi:IclR family transcriptional regulator [Vibrio mangrovi]|uniref:IclR family transcriptional regulator n=1 Tax=Vibrio mangrovi TaxID=474394 RepID=A0A1Y6ISY5_9VIBR|nr:IclR family transcriptional regulator [Vibrio mangrovi]MDW6003291.1 IclR family transcriptional regulator [Vibrio mangrovi]SMR99920.1 putative HTH-type transcriptional regulator RhmR [Vibrio mangrovi]